MQKFCQAFLRKRTSDPVYVKINFVILNQVSYDNNVITKIIMMMMIMIIIIIIFRGFSFSVYYLLCFTLNKYDIIPTIRYNVLLYWFYSCKYQRQDPIIRTVFHKSLYGSLVGRRGTTHTTNGLNTPSPLLLKL